MVLPPPYTLGSPGQGRQTRRRRTRGGGRSPVHSFPDPRRGLSAPGPRQRIQGQGRSVGAPSRGSAHHLHSPGDRTVSRQGPEPVDTACKPEPTNRVQTRSSTPLTHLEVLEPRGPTRPKRTARGEQGRRGSIRRLRTGDCQGGQRPIGSGAVTRGSSKRKRIKSLLY